MELLSKTKYSECDTAQLSQNTWLDEKGARTTARNEYINQYKALKKRPDKHIPTQPHTQIDM